MLDTYSLQKDGWNPKGSVGGLPLFDVPLFLRATHALELEVAVVGLWSDSLGLEDDKGNRSDDLKMSVTLLALKWCRWHIYRDEVQRQIHEVSDDRRGSELSERLAGQLAESCNHVSGATALDLTFLGNKSRLAALDECAIEGVDEAVFDEKSLAEDHGKGA